MLLPIVKTLVKNRQLTLEMTRREISDRYSGQAFGTFWTFGHPIFVMALYVFVFAVVFKTKLGGTHDMPLDYTTYLLSGLIPWMAFQESMVKSCSAIVGNSGLVKQVVFPLEVLPAKGVLASLITQLIAMTVLVLYVIFKHHFLCPMYMMIPVLLLLQVSFMLGLAYILSAIGTYFRDVKDFIQLFAIAGIYLIPVVYLPEWVPDLFKPVIYLNPISHMIWCFQDVFYFGGFVHTTAWLVNSLVSIAILPMGYAVFRKLRVGFGNVL